MKTHPNCKINLGLHVIERRPDGYHNLESIFLPVFDLCDDLEIIPLPDKPYGYCQFSQDGIPITCNTEDNLCVRAYKLLQQQFPLKVGAVRIHLTKKIPFGAGLGGGSSDATFVLRMLNELYKLSLSDEQLCHYAIQLGADCPFFVHNQAAYVTGIGDQQELLNFSLEDAGLRLFIRKPDDSVSTREAYAGIKPRNIQPHIATPNLKEALRQPVTEWRDLFVNDFEKTVFPNHPAIAQLKKQFYQEGAVYASMTGSGAAVFGIFIK
ncbi:MAG: 4-(cytidine 5'-diphospho)-2-C-methyl-D-erythritol kinase [Bacteroidales bacterium]|nr:4-(cytidine 5'-diphospho)-2-C-methyl-D-erythritol kinase [Bacteroidales bacterium]